MITDSNCFLTTHDHLCALINSVQIAEKLPANVAHGQQSFSAAYQCPPRRAFSEGGLISLPTAALAKVGAKDG
jgi:hypothetical protein